jgi:hypothetical protein
MGLDLEQRVRRRMSVAHDYLEAHDFLAARLDPSFGPAATLLGLLGFEILLKTVWIADRCGEPPKVHNYWELWQGLKDPTQAEILASAMLRIGPSQLSNLPFVLNSLSMAFARGRYLYEPNEARTLLEIKQVSDDWDGSFETADFALFPEECYGLREAMKTWLRDRFPEG